MFLCRKFSNRLLFFNLKQNLSHQEIKTNLCKATFLLKKLSFFLFFKDEITRIVRNNEGKFFINMNDSLFPLFIDGTLLDYRLKLRALSESSVENLQIFNKNFEEYAVTTPIFYVIEDDFYLKLGNEIYFIVVKMDYFIDKQELKQNQENVWSYEFSKRLPGDFIEKESTLSFQNSLLRNLQKFDKKFMNINIVKNCIFDSINQISIQKKKQLELLEFKINIIEKKLENLLKVKEKVEGILEKKSKRRITVLLSMILTQICLIQYGTYYVFSWDIMEPITCLLGVVDLIIPYYFWLRHQKDYSFETVKEVIMEKKQARAYKKKDFIKEEIEYQKEILECLKRRRMFYSENIDLIFNELKLT